MTTQRKLSELWVQYSEGSGKRTVWFATKTHAGVDSKLALEKFLEADWLKSADVVRVVGSLANAPLIRALWNAKLSGQLSAVVLICRPEKDPHHPVKDPNRVFNWMRRVYFPPSVGGWHRMTSDDYITYSLVEECQRDFQYDEPRLSELTVSLLKAHPAYPAVAFPATAYLTAAAFVLAAIVDPRWHVEESHPDRQKRYRRVMGVMNERAASRLLTALEKPSWPPNLQNPVNRSRLAARAWASTWQQVARADTFLSKIVMEQSTHAEGVLTATRLYLQFVKDVWLDSLTPNRHYIPLGAQKRLCKCSRYSPTLFVPEYFFNHDKGLIKQWHVHRSTLVRS